MYDVRDGRSSRGDATAPSAPPEAMFRPSSRVPSVLPPRSTCSIAVAGAKGGAGTSVMAANLALYFSSIGRSVLLVDADPNGANLHTFVGAPSPSRATSERPVFESTQVQGLRLLWAGLDRGLGGRMRGGRSALDAAIAAERAEYVVIDLGACTHRAAMDAFLTADLALLVTLPEPTALESTYRILRRAFLRYLKKRVVDRGVREALMSKAREMGGAPSPLDLWRKLEDDGDPLSEVVRAHMEQFHPAIVINQTRLRADLELGEQVRSAARRRLGIPVEYLGHVEYDDTVWSCVRSRRLLLIESPGTKASKNVEKIARRLLASQSGKRKPQQRTVPPESHHDLLEVERGATDEEVRRAFKRAKDIYAEDALACYSLFEAHELTVLRRRMEEAYDVLLDPVRRRPYELSVFPSQADEEVLPLRAQRVDPLPAPPEVTPDTDYTGALLRAVRESQGISLKEIAARTKVGVGYLEAIESDDFAALPAPVYVRGFVTEMAKVLRLDASQVARTYGRRLKRWTEDRTKTP